MIHSQEIDRAAPFYLCGSGEIRSAECSVTSKHLNNLSFAVTCINITCIMTLCTNVKNNCGNNQHQYAIKYASNANYLHGNFGASF